MVNRLQFSVKRRLYPLVLAFVTIGSCTIALTGTALAVPAPPANKPLLATRSTPNVASKGAPLRIVAFGSSSTAGVGATTPTAAYPAQLQTLLTRLMPVGRAVQVLNRGIGGEDADDMVKRLQSDVIARHPDVVIWQTGSNDPIRRVPLDRFDRETRAGIAAMEKSGIEVILMEPQWCPRLASIATTAAYQDIIRKIGADMHVDVIRRGDLMHEWLREGLLTRAQMLSPDGLHMTDGGYAMLARTVAPEVLKVEDLKPVLQASETKTAPAVPRAN